MAHHVGISSYKRARSVRNLKTGLFYPRQVIRS